MGTNWKVGTMTIICHSSLTITRVVISTGSGSGGRGSSCSRSREENYKEKYIEKNEKSRNLRQEVEKLCQESSRGKLCHQNYATKTTPIVGSVSLIL